MRARSRSHSRLVLAGLGVAAALVAVASSDQSSRPADATPIASVAGDSETALGPNNIRSVDFGEVAPPGTVCDDGLRFTPPARIPVQGGRSRVLDLGRLTRVEVDPDVAYGDLDGDDRDEAVVHVVCSYGANGAEDSLHVWGLAAGRVVHVASVSEPPASLTGPLPPTVVDVAVAGGEVEVTWTHYAADDPNCCPSEQTVVTYALDGRTLDRMGRPVTRPA
ncbi:MAG: LppP/LprE family lipoprotein [Acidimicrobiales bacterium]